MTWEILKNVDDYRSPRGKSSIALNPDKVISPYQISYPITWKGNVGGHPVLVIQKTDNSSSFDNYEFVNFPSVISHLKSDIVELINK